MLGVGLLIDLGVQARKSGCRVETWGPDLRYVVWLRKHADLTGQMHPVTGAASGLGNLWEGMEEQGFPLRFAISRCDSFLSSMTVLHSTWTLSSDVRLPNPVVHKVVSVILCAGSGPDVKACSEAMSDHYTAFSGVSLHDACSKSAVDGLPSQPERPDGVEGAETLYAQMLETNTRVKRR